MAAQAWLAARLDELEGQRSADVRRRLQDARQVDCDAQAAGLDVEARRAQLVVADMLLRLGDGTQAAQLAVEVNAWALASGPRSLQSRSHLVLSSVFESIGDTASSLDHAVRAFGLLDPAASGCDRGHTLLRLADACALIGAVEQARTRYGEAEAVFAALNDHDHQLIVLNNLAVLEYECGEVDAALVAVQRLAHGCGPDGMHSSYADTIARAHLAAGDVSAAEQMVLRGFELWRRDGDAQAVTPAELALTHVEILLAQQRIDEAAERLEFCMTVCAERDLRGIRVQALDQQASVLAARGDYQGAYLAYRTFHTEFVAVRSHQQEAAARTRQALAETAAARAEAQRFWEQARTDPLTELVNRRFVDEELPRLLLESRDDRCLVAAIVDADHFKQVNDRFSHAAGDQVLRRLAGLLTAAVPAGPHRGFAARLGGEEFLLVLTGESAPDLVARLEAVRTGVHDGQWQDIDADLEVSVSIGAALAQATDTQTSLLTRADAHLYLAKQQGRNRTVSDLDARARAVGPQRQRAT
jgi:two-component system, cell cycle response regulator